ncbi:hypothetical protein GGF41_008062, partial [Coemansia sp. RSA 2531]
FRSAPHTRRRTPVLTALWQPRLPPHTAPMQRPIHNSSRPSTPPRPTCISSSNSTLVMSIRLHHGDFPRFLSCWFRREPLNN